MSAQAVTAAKLLTPEQVAERWQVPRTQIYRLCRENRVPHVQLGRYVRLRVQDIEEFEANGGTDGE